MQPKDMAKKRFKLIPGADYSEGPISKYGTFGNMLRTRALTGLKKSADNIPMRADEVTGKNIEQITDMFNPMAGAMKFVKGMSSIKPSKSVTKTRFEDPYFKQGVEDHINDKNRYAFSDSEQRTYFENLSPHMHPYHSGEELFRGMTITPDDEIMQLKQGDYFMSDRAMPFSRKLVVADAFASPTAQNPNGVLMHVPKPKSGIDMWDLRNDNAWDESEVTIPANVKYKVQELYDKTINDVPRREMILEEVDTIPEGSRLLHYRTDKRTDYTNDEKVAETLKTYEEGYERAKSKNLPGVTRMMKKRLDSFKSKYKESQLNRPKGAEGTTTSVPEFIKPRRDNFNDKFKITEREPDVQGDISNLDYLKSII